MHSNLPTSLYVFSYMYNVMLIVSGFHHWQVLYLQAAVLLWVTTSLVKNLFFGTLRAAEVEVDSTSLCLSIVVFAPFYENNVHDYLGCAVLCFALNCCLFDLACFFFLPSHLSLKHVHYMWI